MEDQFDLDNEPIQGAPRVADSPRNARRAARAHDDTSSAPSGVHLTDYVKIVYKRRWMAITAFLLVVGVVAVNTFTATPIYEASTRLLIESDEQNVVTFKQVIEGDQAKQDYYQTQYNVLQSRALARKTLDSLKLWDRPPFGGSGPAKPSTSWLSSIKKVIRGQEPAPEPSRAADETAAQSRAIDALLRNLTVSPVKNSRLVDVRYRLPDPQLATDIVNAIAKNYIQQNLEFKFLASKEASDWLGERLAEQRTQVEKAEGALQRYREQNDAISLEDRENIVVQKLSDLNAAVTRAKTERIQKEALYNQLREGQANPSTLDSFPAILTNSFVQQLKAELAGLQQQEAQASEKFGDKHPELQRIRTAIQVANTKLNGEIARVVSSVRSEYLSALAQEQSLSAALNEQKGAALSMNRKAIDYAVLERDVESSKQLYNNLMQRAKETGVATELRTSNIRVIDPAERPRGAVFPKTRSNMMMGFAGGLMLALGLVFFFEYLDSRIKTPDEIKTHLRLPHLGLLPSLDAKTLGGAYPLLSNGVPANFSEAFRGVRTNVLFATAQEGSRSLVVTSTGPGEGKSMVASNIAVGLAQAGQRVLLIDADMRKPKMHDIFDLSQEPGLSNLLVGNCKASEAVRKTDVAGLWVVAAGKIPPNPAELLGSNRFRDFTLSLKSHFDWVVIDTPPVMAVTDASLIAHHASGVLFVVGAEMTSRHAAARALDQLEQVDARFIGAVLNRVDLDRNPYYYSQYYRREYAQYYAKS